MKIAIRWIRQLSEKAPEFSIQYHADQDLGELRDFWSATLGIDPDAIRLQRKSSSSQMAGRQWRSRYGVVDARVQDTLLRARLQGWMDCLRAEWQ